MLRQALCIMIPSVHTDEPFKLHMAGNMALEPTCWESLLNGFTADCPHTHTKTHTQIKCTFCAHTSIEMGIAMYYIKEENTPALWRKTC